METNTSEEEVELKIEFNGFETREKELRVNAGTGYSQVLNDMGINPETVVILKDGLPVPTDEVVEEGTVKVIRVISGG